MDSLENISFAGRGRFTTQFASFAVGRYSLEQDWDYVLGDHRLYWRIHHNGRGYLQAAPPGGAYWLWSDENDPCPPWMVYIIDSEKPGDWFTNFWGPRIGPIPFGEPERFECRFSAGKADIRIVNDELDVQTQLGILHALPVAAMRLQVRNSGRRPRKLKLVAVLRPHLISPDSNSWDMPHIYQSTEYRHSANSVRFDMGDPMGRASHRKRLEWSLNRAFDKICLDPGAFVGKGFSVFPESLGSFANWRKCKSSTLYGKGLFAAFSHALELLPDHTWDVEMLLGEKLPGISRSRSIHIGNELQKLGRQKKRVLSQWWISFPDPAFSRYANEYLALQQELVLQRGWPGMLGTRDTAQDFTPAATLYPGRTRAMILRILEAQRQDGSFLRQFSADGRFGKHDERLYVDSGLWVWELVHEYVCSNRDFSLLARKIPFLDSDRKTSVLDHLVRAITYFLEPENIGEHGLCKIREGDWNDSVNRAGQKGIGETVMVSCHLIIILTQFAQLLDFVSDHQGKGNAVIPKGTPSAESLRRSARDLRNRVRKHALNPGGFVNGVYSDIGKWFFSNRDPDGKCRMSIPVNAFALLAGVFTAKETKNLLLRIRNTGRAYGIPLFSPPVIKPMRGLGRIGTGDLRAGLGENGTCYNHGCHGFLGRALAALGDGDFLYEVVQFMFPYDQEKHPVAQAQKAPYAIVNSYLSAPGMEGRGGETFFSGSIATAFRNVYQGMLGVQFLPGGLRITPCFPISWPEISGQVLYCKKPLRIHVKRVKRKLAIRVNGRRIRGSFVPASSLI